MTVRHRLYATAAGRVLGVDVEVRVDAGAYAGLSTVVAERANASAVGPYAVDAVRVVTKVCYTNNLFGGPYRGFGAPQVTVAHECQMDRLARQVGLSPLEVRRRNGLGPGAAIGSTGETILAPERYAAVLDVAGRILAAGDAGASEDPTGRYRFGTGLGTFIYGCNLHFGGQPHDQGGAYVLVQADGSVNVAIGVTEMGQGALAAARAMAAEALGAPETAVRVSEVDTALVADSGPTVASRATLVAGWAILDAAAQLLPRLRALAAGKLGVPADQVEVRPGGGFGVAGSERTVTFAEVAGLMSARRVNPAAVGFYRSEDRVYDVTTGQGQAYAFYSFGAHVARVRVDTWTGKVDVLSIDAVHDVGRVIHAPSLEGQVEGGAVQAAGWATMEDLHLQEGRLLNPSFTDYLMPTAVDAPVVRLHLIEDPEPQGPFGARGIGEPSFIPGGAAIACAVARALGRPVADLPLVPERVLGLITQA
jgi:CO/xanthine dehydrogenase Mo-binding subunit